MKKTFLVGMVTVAFGTACGEGAARGEENTPSSDAAVMTAGQALLEHERFPGLALATVARDGVTWTASLGYADPDRDFPVTPDTSFWLASVTKPVTGLAILAALEDGALGLDTPIAALLDANAGFELGSPRAREITVEHLVTHRSSILDSDAYACAYFVEDEAGKHLSLANELLGERVCDEQSAADLGGFLASYLDPAGIYYAPENFGPERPGTHFEYSNVGAALAGHSVELATGSSLADYARERFFEPLGLTHTSFRLSELAPSSVAVPHLRDPETGASTPIPLYGLSTWPDGGLRSSVSDFGKLLAAVMSGGALDGVRILEQSSVTAALDPLASLDDETDIGVFWILGSREVLPQDSKPRDLAFHDGGDPGAFSYVLFDRNAGVGLVILANGDFGGEAGSEEVLAELVQELFALAIERADGAPVSR